MVSGGDPFGPSNPLRSVVVKAPGAWLDNFGAHPWMLVAPVFGFVGAVIALWGVRAGKSVAAIGGSPLSALGIISTVGLNKGGRVESRRLSEDAVRQILLRRAGQAGVKGSPLEPVSPHGLRAGFVTTAYRNGVNDEEIIGHTRHRSLTTMRSYVRRAKLSKTAPTGKLGL